MGSGRHSQEPKAILGRNLRAAFEKRGLSARSVSRSLNASGMKISNKTVSNMLNGVGNPQLSNLLAVAKQARVPLWQLLCPSIEISHFGSAELHDLVERIANLSETGQAQVRRTIKAEALMAGEESLPTSSSRT